MVRHALSLVTCLALGMLFAEQLIGQELPTPQPTEAHRLLAADEGTWDADIKMYLQGPTGPPENYKGVEINEVVVGGLATRSAFKSKMGDRDYEGYGINGYDDRAKEYVSMWIDNLSAAPTEVRGKYDAEKKTLTMFSTVFDPSSGQEIKQRQVTTYLDEKTKTFEIFLVVDVGGETQDLKLMEMTLKKR